MMRGLLICSLILAVCAIDFRSRNTPHEFDLNNYPAIEELSQLLKMNPYQQFLPESNQDRLDPSYIIPSLSYVGQQFNSLPSSTYSPNMSGTPAATGALNINSSLYSSTLAPAIKITRQPFSTAQRPQAKLSKLNKMNAMSLSTPPALEGTLEQIGYAAFRSNAHISVPSYRLMNDILVIPSNRRLYLLLIIPIHESSGAQGFECGNVDVNAFVRLAAFLKSLEDVNSGIALSESGLHIGAIIIDSCSSDLRTLADLYELLSGTNIEKGDIIAIVRDDRSYLPNIDEFANYLRIPVINTFYTIREQALTTGTLPTEEEPLQAILDLLKHTQSTCVSVVFDDLHAPMALKLQQLASERVMCLDEQLQVRGASTIETQQNVVQKLLLSEARIVLVLYGEKSWLEFIKALNNEMVIPGRFVFVALQDERWSTSRLFLDSWPHFDQLLISVATKSSPNYSYLSQLTNAFPKLPFPQQWLRQFWTTAFQCHIDGETAPREQFSRPCPHQQNLNLTAISPDMNIAPIGFAVHVAAVALKKLSDHVCPGALIHTLTDCLNDPYRSLYAAMITAEFVHPLSKDHFKMNSTSKFPSAELVLNRVIFQQGELLYEEIAVWDSNNGLTYTSGSELLVEERDGSRVRVASKCPKSTCSSLALLKSKVSGYPSFKSGLNNLPTLIFSVVAIVLSFVCLLCVYQQLVSNRSNPYYTCTIVMFIGLTLLTLISPFFMMGPSWITCALRRSCFSVAVACIVAPILVRTILIGRQTIMQTRRGDSLPYASPLAMVVISAVLVLFQVVIVAEWAIFDDPTQLEFIQFGNEFSWRCTPGTKFEHHILYSMTMIILMIAIILLCSILNIKNHESQQHVAFAITTLVFGVTLYLVLPLLRFDLRDQVFAIAMIVYVVINIFIAYSKNLFCPAVGMASNENLVEKALKASDRSEFSLDQRLFVQPSIFGQTLNSFANKPGDANGHKMPLSYRSSLVSEYKVSNFA